MIASIPSPSTGTIDARSAHPQRLRADDRPRCHRRRLAVRPAARGAGIGTRKDDASAIAIWAVLAGVIGARLYHVVTDWDRFEGDLGRHRQDLGGRPRHPRRARSPGPRRPLGRPAPRHPDGRRAQHAPPRDAAGAGDRPVGQLVQPGALRPADRPAVGARDRRRAPPAGLPSARRSIRRSSTSRCGTSALCGCCCGSIGASGRPVASCWRVRDRLRRRTLLDRGLRIDPATRSGGCAGTSGSPWLDRGRWRLLFLIAHADKPNRPRCPARGGAGREDEAGELRSVSLRRVDDVVGETVKSMKPLTPAMTEDVAGGCGPRPPSLSENLETSDPPPGRTVRSVRSGWDGLRRPPAPVELTRYSSPGT